MRIAFLSSPKNEPSALPRPLVVFLAIAIRCCVSGFRISNAPFGLKRPFFSFTKYHWRSSMMSAFRVNWVVTNARLFNSSPRGEKRVMRNTLKFKRIFGQLYDSD